MQINFEKLERKFWFEDENGNVVYQGDPKACFYHCCFPLEIHDQLDEYCYHPKNPIVKFLCRKSRTLYRLFSKHGDKTYKPILDCTTYYGGGADCIIAMVNSGDFTLEQAIWVYANSCERCMNVLRYKYLNGADGYPEYSEEWKKANTVCDFCRHEEDSK